MVSYPPFVHAIGGSIGGALATLAFYPLELIRVEMQSQAEEVNTGGNSNSNPQENNDDGEECRRTDGPTTSTTTSNHKQPETNLEVFIRLYKKKSLYRGASSMTTTMMISNFIFFYTLQVIRKSMVTHGQQHNGNHLQKQQRNGKILRFLLNLILPKSKLGTSLFASSLAGVINVFLTTPLWVATRRIMEGSQPVVVHNNPPLSISQSCHSGDEQEEKTQKQQQQQQQPNLWNVMHSISCNEGVLQLWHGTWSSLLLVSNPAIQYFLYEQVRVWLLERRNSSSRQGSSRRSDNRHGGGRDGSHPKASLSSLTPMEAFVFGALAKTVSTVITYPMQLGQVLMRLRNSEINNNASLSQSKHEHTTEGVNGGSNNDMKAYNGMIDCLYQQFTRGGFYSLFQGMNSKLLQTVLSAAFTFLTYEQTLVLIGRVYQSSLAT